MRTYSKNKLIKVCRDLKLLGEHEMADIVNCAISALANSKHPRHDLSYSYVMRELRKKHPKKVEIFQKNFKQTFDEALSSGLDNAEELALMSALETTGVEIG